MRMRAGFTLIEVLVGLSVSALALTAGFAALSFVADRAAQAEAATVSALEGVAARELLVEWLTGARLRAPGNTGSFQGTDGEARGGLPDDQLMFPTTARTPLHVRNTVVRLYIDREDETPETGLVAELTERIQDEPRRFELVPQVIGLDIHYLPEAADAFEWLPDWLGRNQLPRAVELVLHVAPGDTVPPLLRYPIRVALGR
jgi:prepilin-type N-terminal cleavage/methylation domain-containing protein